MMDSGTTWDDIIISRRTRLYASIKFYRIHTVALTSMLFLIGYLLTGAYLFSWGAVAWWMAGVFWHSFGFAHNNMRDYELDQTDDHKVGHPHHDGILSRLNVADLTLLAGIVAVGYIVWLAGNDFSRLIFVASVVFGLAYNWTSKSSILAPVYAALCYMLIPLIPYTALGGDLGSPIIYLVVFYIFAQIVFQIAWLGSLKDYKADPYNFIKGTSRYMEWGILMKCAQILAVIWLMVFIPTGLHWFFVIGIITVEWCLLFWTIPIAGFIHDMVMLRDPETYTTHLISKMCAIHELILMFVLIMLLAPLLGWQVFVLFVIALLWYFVWNRIYWGTIVTPKV